jgi:hypothetical protein
MTKTKTVRLKPFEKMLNVMISGKPVTKEEFDTLLGSEIMMYRISTYIWHIKTIANGTVKVIKDGRKVAAYQLMNVDTVKKYLEDNGVLLAKTSQVKKLKDLGAQVEPVVTESAPASVSEDLQVTEIV